MLWVNDFLESQQEGIEARSNPIILKLLEYDHLIDKEVSKPFSNGF